MRKIEIYYYLGLRPPLLSLPEEGGGVQELFGGIGYISKVNDRSTVEFRVSKIHDLFNVIIPHLYKYSIKTNKYIYFLLFARIVQLILENKHKTMEGLQEILKHRGVLN